MTLKTIKLYAFKNNLNTITLNQYEHTIAQLCFKLFCEDNNNPLDLTTFDEVRFYAKKEDGTIVGKVCTVEKNQAMLAVPLQLTSAKGVAECTVECSKSDGNIRFGGFKINVIPSQDSDEAIESSDEFTLLESTIAEAKKIISQGVATDEQLENAVKNYLDENPIPVLTESDKTDIARIVIENLGGEPIFGYVDENNNIIISGKLAQDTYNVKYEMEDGTTIDIGELDFDDNVYYAVTNELTNCTNNNSATQVIEGNSYTAEISTNSGYELSSVTVTMGGSPVSVSGGTINIANVTGDIVITAVAEVAEVKPAYTNLADPTSDEWMDNYRITSSGAVEATSGVTLMNAIACVQGDTIRVKGVSDIQCAMFKNGTFYSRASVTSNSTQFGNPIVDGDYSEFTIAHNGITSIRFYGTLSGAAEDVIITVNEEIV